MKLSYIFEMLASGELGNLHLVEEDKLSIKPDKALIIVRNVNAALNDLHTRFTLKKNVVDVPVIVGEDTYEIDTDDFIEVLDIYQDGLAMGAGTQYVMLSPNRIKFKDKLGILSTISVEYKAKHRVLSEVDITMDSEVNLPDSYLNALMYFIASRLYTSAVNRLDGDLNEGTTYMSKFLAEVALLTNQGIDVDEFIPMDNFNSRGFV